MYQVRTKDVYFDTLYFEFKLLHHKGKFKGVSKAAERSLFDIFLVFQPQNFGALAKPNLHPKLQANTMKHYDSIWVTMKYSKISGRRSRKRSYERPPDTEKDSII